VQKLQAWLRVMHSNEDFVPGFDAALYLRRMEYSATPLQKYQNKHRNVWKAQWKKVI
jgi:hypothetical protein